MLLYIGLHTIVCSHTMSKVAAEFSAIAYSTASSHFLTVFFINEYSIFGSSSFSWYILHPQSTHKPNFQILLHVKIILLIDISILLFNTLFILVIHQFSFDKFQLALLVCAYISSNLLLTTIYCRLISVMLLGPMHCVLVADLSSCRYINFPAFCLCLCSIH